MGSSSRYKRGVRAKKRKLNIARDESNNVDSVNNNENPSSTSSASSRKLEAKQTEDTVINPEGTLFMNSSVILEMLHNVGKCPTCIADISVEHVFEQQQKGLAHFISIKST